MKGALAAAAELEALSLKSRFEEAALLGQRYTQLWPTHPEVLYQCALAVGYLGEVDTAIRLLNQSLEAGKDRYSICWRRGYFELLRGIFLRQWTTW